MIAVFLPLRIKIIFGLIVFILFVSFCYFVFISPEIKILAQSKQKHALLVASLHQRNAKLGDLKKQQTLTNASEKNSQKTLRSLGSTFYLNDFLATIISTAQKHQVNVQTLAPQAVITNNDFSLQPIHLVMSGNYYSLKSWLVDVLSAEHLTIKQLLISFKKDSGLILDAEVEVYRVI